MPLRANAVRYYSRVWLASLSLVKSSLSPAFATTAAPACQQAPAVLNIHPDFFVEKAACEARAPLPLLPLFFAPSRALLDSGGRKHPRVHI